MPTPASQLRLVRTRGTVDNVAAATQCFCITTSAVLCFSCLGRFSATRSLFVLQDFGKGRTLTSRCDFHQNLQRRGCETRHIEYPTSSISVRRNMPLSSKESSVNRYEMIQIMPQDLALKLRPGEGFTPFKKSKSSTVNQMASSFVDFVL